PKCKMKRVLTPKEVASLGEMIPEISKIGSREFFMGKGCAACGQSGYQGRMSINEVIEVNDEIRQLIMNRANATQIKEAAIRSGMTTMMLAGVERALKGLTSIEEVVRIIHE
ncbi:MAG: type II secretion system protein GspE, partial [Patescibacteria group bacterium]